MTELLNKLLDSLTWEPIETPESNNTTSEVYVTHRGVLKVDDFEIYCYRCSDGEVAFDCEDMERFLRGCHQCDHPSQCPGCNPTDTERNAVIREGIRCNENLDTERELASL
ncbi:MAG: hypothetical protein SFY66_14350 [Oculatellaceae cyanobacterium bins.114]|nr:hypothetical protein [Oculatellaceae cyanobacterium bins.114]